MKGKGGITFRKTHVFKVAKCRPLKIGRILIINAPITKAES